MSTAIDMESEREKEEEEKPSLMSINDTKAGMKGLDKERINRVIHEVSKDSPFYNHQKERQKRIDHQVETMLGSVQRMKPEDRLNAKRKMDRMAYELEPQRQDLSRIIVHLDMDMFFAAVEIKDDPSLAEKPMAVGSLSMLSTSNYLARSFGVRAGMPGFIAKKLCPQLCIVPINMNKYIESSRQVMDVIREYDPEMSASIDEAHFDLTDYVRILYENEGSPARKSLAFGQILPPEMWSIAESVVLEIREKITAKTTLTASAGIAPNKMLAKICSDLNKPNGQYVLAGTSVDAVRYFVDNTQVRKVSGVGPVQEQLLKGLGINTCREMWEKRDLIYLLFTPSSLQFYLRVSLGIGSNRVGNDEEDIKSKGNETTFRPTSDILELSAILKKLADEVSESLREMKLKGKTITLRLKRASFDANVRSKSLAFHTNDAQIIFETAKKTLIQELEAKDLSKSGNLIRLMGVRVSNFEAREGNVCKSQSKSQSKQTTLSSLWKGHSPVLGQPMDVEELSVDRQSTVCVICPQPFDDILSLDHMDADDCGLCTFGNSPVREASSSSCLETKREPTAAQLECDLTLSCPICGLTQGLNTLDQLNQHLDYCLSRDLISELSTGPSESGPVPFRETPVNSSLRASQKRKNDEESGIKDKCAFRRIDDYFK